PLPSAGGFIVHFCLSMMQRLDLHHAPAVSVDRIDLIARIFRVAFALRQKFGGDPDHLSPEARQEGDKLTQENFNLSDFERWEQELGGMTSLAIDRQMHSQNTTHFCVLDSEGAAVSNTYSLNTMFGAKLVVEGAGFLLNNCIDDFCITPES